MRDARYNSHSTLRHTVTKNTKPALKYKLKDLVFSVKLQVKLLVGVLLLVLLVVLVVVLVVVVTGGKQSQLLVP